MTRKLILTLIFGVVGAVILLWLGSWQVSRLTWKNAVLNDIEARIVAAPVAIPEMPDPVEHRYLPVTVSGTIESGVRVFTSVKGQGAGFRMVSVLTTPGTNGPRRILLDRGFLKQDQVSALIASSEVTVTGNLHWPDEVDGFTPPPEGTTWYARDLAGISTVLGTEPVLVVARTVSPGNLNARTLPVSTEGIPNDHLGYAITWFSLAFVWLVMTAVVLWRIRQRTL